MEQRSTLVPGLILAAIVLVLDQITKWWIVDYVMNPPAAIEVTSFFNIVMAWNKGVSFGMFSGDSPWNAWILSGLALSVAAVLIVWLSRNTDRLVGTSLGVIIGGAIGNAIDRFHWGAVADFLDFHAMGYHWPAFNVADMAITLGAGLLIFDSLFGSENSPKKESSDLQGNDDE